MTLINKEDKIFIAGGSGMVGSAIIRKLIDLGFRNLIFPNIKIISKFQKQLLPIVDEFSKIFKHKQPGGVIL